MAFITLTSAKGAPGVTTTSLALALHWPRPVLLVEADVAGSSSILAGYLRGLTRHDRGLVDLAVAHRRGALDNALQAVSMELPGSQARLVAGFTGPSQATALLQVWEPLAALFRGLQRAGIDVIVDAGRLGAIAGPAPLLRESDLVLLTTRTSLPAIAAARARAAAYAGDTTESAPLGLLLVGEGQPYSAREIKPLIPAPVVATVSWDPVHAEVFSLGAKPGRRLDTSSLVRSVHAAGAAIRATVTDRQTQLNPEPAIGGPDGGHAHG